MIKHNNHPHRLYDLICAALLLGGCGSPEPPDDAFEPDAPRTVTPGLEPECAELRGPIIGKVPQDLAGGYDCEFDDLPADWEAVPLFSNGSPWMAAQVATMPLPADSPLLAYCKYEYVGDNTTTPNTLVDEYEDFFNIATAGGRLVGLPATDCPSVTGQGGLDNLDVIGASSDIFMDAVDAIDGTAMDDLDLDTVHTYLLDTQQGDLEAYDPHAVYLRTMLEDLACADDRSGCVDDIHPILVTPLRAANDFDRPQWDADDDGLTGGTHGYVHQLALGVAIAVLDWRERNDDDNPLTLERGVINVSMGAVPSSSYATDLNYAPAQAVVDAMRMAVCYDLPIFAAAGNRDIADVNCENPDDPGEGLLLPAAYETLAMPTVADCLEWGYEPDWDTTSFPLFVSSMDPDKPLVTAVSAVDHEDRLLQGNRLDSTTILAAPGLSAVTPSGSTPLTGSSVAALVATAGVNLNWSADPSVHSRYATGLLYNAGWDTGLTNEAGWYANMDVHRISLCAALDDAVGGLNCSAAAPNIGATAAIGTATLATIAAAQPGEVESFTDQGGSSTPVCEQVPLDLVIPQPQRPHCATCSVGKNTGSGGLHTLYMTIAPETWTETMSVTAATLYVTDGMNQTTSYSLDSNVIAQIEEMDPDVTIEVQFDHSGPNSASLKLKYTGASGTLSVINTLPVW